MPQFTCLIYLGGTPALESQINGLFLSVKAGSMRGPLEAKALYFQAY